MKEKFLQTLFIRLPDIFEVLTSVNHYYFIIPSILVMNSKGEIKLKLLELLHYKGEENTIPHSNSLTVETLKMTGGPAGRGTDLIDTLNLFRKRYTDKDGKAFTLKDVEKIYIEGLTTAMTLREYNSHGLFFSDSKGNIIDPEVIFREYLSEAEYFRVMRTHERDMCVTGKVCDFLLESKKLFSKQSCIVSLDVKGEFFSGTAMDGSIYTQNALAAVRFKNEDEALRYLMDNDEAFKDSGYEIVSIPWLTHVYGRA